MLAYGFLLFPILASGFLSLPILASCFLLFPIAPYGFLLLPMAPILAYGFLLLLFSLVAAYLLLFSAAKLLIISNNFHNIMWISSKAPINFLPLQEIDLLIAQKGLLDIRAMDKIRTNDEILLFPIAYKHVRVFSQLLLTENIQCAKFIIFLYLLLWFIS